ncbi:hypothetical protein ACFO0N_17495 [Halobium salinum]|uniref:Tat pathway signal sequence domain protein n=1 Tax=Halobium salinum TaxID=1364940 RepID=A0ABD5PG44_9EURY|nr:hypothetical protein [Halobium salinum]
MSRDEPGGGPESRRASDPGSGDRRPRARGGRRSFLRRLAGAGGAGLLGSTAGCLGAGVVRTKTGGGSETALDLAGSDHRNRLDADEYGEYAARMQVEYGEGVLPWATLDEFVSSTDAGVDTEYAGAWAQQRVYHTETPYAVADSLAVAHRVETGTAEDARSGEGVRYRIRLWRAGRLTERAYAVDPWGLYRTRTAFTWFGHRVAVPSGAALVAVGSGWGGPRRPDGGDRRGGDAGSFTARAEDGEYELRWDSFHDGVVALVGTCDVWYPDPKRSRRRELPLDWSTEAGVGIRTPY